MRTAHIFPFHTKNQTIPSDIQILITKSFDVGVTVKYSYHFAGSSCRDAVAR